MGILLSWIVIAFALGIENAAYLAATVFVVQAAKTLTLARLGRLARSSASRALAYKVAIAGLLVCAALVGGMVIALEAVDRWPMTAMLPLIVIGLPVRYFLAFTRPDRNRVAKFRIALSFSGLLLVVLALVLDTGFEGAALAIGLREWLAFAFVLIGQRGSVPAVPQPVITNDGGDAWDDFLQATHARSRRRLVTRAVKSILGSVLGPLAGILSRTGRGVGLDRWLARFVPDSVWGLSVTAISLAVAGASAVLMGSSAWTAMLGATALRLGAATAAPVLWSALRTTRPPPAT